MRPLIFTLAVSVALMLTTHAGGASTQASATLAFSAQFDASYAFGATYCPPGTPTTVTDCIGFGGTAAVRGLGQVTEDYVKFFDPTVCPGVTQFKTAVLTVEGKGAIHVSMAWPACGPNAPSQVGPLAGTVTAGSGRFAGASGTLQFSSSVAAPRTGVRGLTGSASDTWSGTLLVPGYEFDLTPPVLLGAASKTVRAPRNAKRTRVRYKVVGRDDVDASVVVDCRPRSGGLFRVGRTIVTCSAVDTSANQATARFAIVVKRRR